MPASELWSSVAVGGSRQCLVSRRHRRLFDAGLDVTAADLIVGISAGSTAAAQIASATPAQLLAGILSVAPQQQTLPVISPDGGVLRYLTSTLAGWTLHES